MKRSRDEETQPEEDEEIEEEQESEEGEEKKAICKQSSLGRNVTLQMLLEENILQPGEANMSIEYMGQRFIGDLLNDGKIKSLETDIIFASPSAWACHCKRIINPDKKSGCGWASVKYQGQKLDVFKNKYFKLKALDQMREQGLVPTLEEIDVKSTQTQSIRIPVKHATLGSKVQVHDCNTLVETTPFSSMGKIQPFLVSLSTNAALVMDFHCHLTTSEVVGYLAGHWDVNAHNLAITQAFPCRSRLNDRELGPLVEEDIYRTIESRRLTLVGWYHSHPQAPPSPTLRDIDSQLEYQIRMKGNSDASYTPCIGIICSAYYTDSVSLESSLASFWVMPPPENKPLDYGKPMSMTYSVMQDQYVSQEALNEMKKCADFYKGDQDFIPFKECYKGNVTYLEKMKTSLSSKLPRDNGEGLLWNYLSELICPGSTGETRPPVPQMPPPIPSTSMSVPLNIPSTSKGIPQPTPGPSSIPSYLGAELASALFATGKFPSSLMGLSSLSGLTGLAFPTPSSMGMLKPHNPFVAPSPVKIPRTGELLDKTYPISSS